MKIDILTLFPNMYEGFLKESIIKRAILNEKVKIDIHNIRDYSLDKHKRVDDIPYGGGQGMILMCQPIYDALLELRKEKTKVILLSPQGVLYNQKIAYRLSQEKHLILISGHYEGFDERITSMVDMELSIGDYILTGGELPSMVVTDSIVRLVPGVITQESHLKESFNDDLLDYPNYTKPRTFQGKKVPEILLSGHHQNIEKWRQTERIIKTMEKRPDLIKKKNSYVLIKDQLNKEVFYLEYEKLEGLNFMPRNNPKREDVINVTKMILVKDTFINKVIKIKIERKLESFIERLHELEEEIDEEDEDVLIKEIERYHQYLIVNYLRYLKKEYQELVLQKIQLLLNELKMKRNLRLNVKAEEKPKKGK